MQKYKVGDQLIYTGPPNSGILAVGDLVEIDAYDAISGLYTVKYPFGYASYTFKVTEAQLQKDTQLTLDFSLPHTYSISKPSDEEITRRKELGLCLKCGDKRKMSMFGLRPCGRCEPL